MNNKTKVLVTGGAGFIGSHLVDRLVSEGFGVRVLDNMSSGNLDNIRGHLDSGKVEFIKGDIKDAKVVGECCSGIDFVAHLAAVVSVPFSVANPSFTFETNVSGSLNMMIGCMKAKVKRFVLASTCAVYGDPAALPVSEETDVKPISPYAESKLAAEKFALGFSERQMLDCVVLRFFNVYGPRQVMNDYSGVITKFLTAARHGLPLTVYGDGSATRDFVFVGDVVSAIMLCFENPSACCEVFNVGTGRATTVNELAKTVLELVPSGKRTVYEKPRVGDIKHSYANISKAQELLGFSARCELKEGLRLLV
ncbi:MAG TPA: NAD-dependent epimerase/dehydratase family protein [Candidatus Sulfotelmatobacter sp.]|nr:NAD-dependent epimerase/dehydratase family protein [Candidatus Sulfotelmatobacter sp.]